MDRETARRMWVLISGLPADARFWDPDRAEEPTGGPDVQRTNDPAAIQQFLGQHLKGG